LHAAFDEALDFVRNMKEMSPLTIAQFVLSLLSFLLLCLAFPLPHLPSLFFLVFVFSFHAVASCSPVRITSLINQAPNHPQGTRFGTDRRSLFRHRSLILISGKRERMEAAHRHAPLDTEIGVFCVENASTMEV